MSSDVILFGHGFDGELVSTEMKAGDTLSIDRRTVLQFSGSTSTTHSRVSSSANAMFSITLHKSGIDGKNYLVAIEDGFTPTDIDLKILWQNPSSVKYK